VWGFGVWVLGFWPKPPIPNPHPQSPIPKEKKNNSINYKNIIKIKNNK